MVFVIQRHASIASHAVSKINTQSFTHSTGVAIRAVEDRAITVIKKIANVAKVFCESLFVQFAFGVDAFLGGWLQRFAFHARDLGDGISIQRCFLVDRRCHRCLSLLL